MPFKDSEDIYQCLGSLFDWAIQQKELSEKLSTLGLTIKIKLVNPEAYMLLDCTKNPPTWVKSDANGVANVEFTMKASDANKFWLGKMNLPVAVMTGEVKVKGQVTKIMGMLSLLAPMKKRYAEILMEKGRTDLLNLQ